MYLVLAVYFLCAAGTLQAVMTILRLFFCSVEDCQSWQIRSLQHLIITTDTFWAFREDHPDKLHQVQIERMAYQELNISHTMACGHPHFLRQIFG